MITGLEDIWLLLVLVVLWTFPWKGVALWRAARRGDKKWFIAIFALNTLAILEIFYIFFVAREKSGKSGGGLIKARAKIQENKKKAKKKILEMVSRKGRVSNNEIEKLLGVSDATATRYLGELEKEGKIAQKGSTRGIFYVRIKS